MEHLQTLEFLDEPNYNSIVKWLNEDLQADPEKDNEFEWQRAGQSVSRVKYDEEAESATEANIF